MVAIPFKGKRVSHRKDVICYDCFFLLLLLLKSCLDRWMAEIFVMIVICMFCFRLIPDFGYHSLNHVTFVSSNSYNHLVLRISGLICSAILVYFFVEKMIFWAKFKDSIFRRVENVVYSYRYNGKI